jgi:hypothetical protein
VVCEGDRGLRNLFRKKNGVGVERTRQGGLNVEQLWIRTRNGKNIGGPDTREVGENRRQFRPPFLEIGFFSYIFNCAVRAYPTASGLTWHI